jgi:hypothetical protein
LTKSRSTDDDWPNLFSAVQRQTALPS